MKIRTTSGKDWPTAVLPSLLLGLNLLIFGTWAVYSRNPGEFLVNYDQLLWKYFAPLLILFVGLGLASTQLGRRSRLIFNTVILFLVLATYIHGNLLSWNTGVLDGKPLDFSESWRNGADGLAWLMLAYLVIRFRRWLYTHGSQLCLLLIAFQGVAALSALLNFEAPEPATTSFPNKLGRFSPDLNVIHIVLDGFQGNVFENLLDADPNLKDDFNGFTLFRDVTTTSDVTYLSIPASLSGKPFTNQSTISEYHQSTLQSENLYSWLDENQFSVDVATPFLWNKPEPWFNSYLRIPTPYASKLEIETSSAYLLLDISLFQQTPHFFKPSVYRSGSWLLSGTLVSNPEQQFQTFSHLAFLDDLQTRLTAAAERPKYKFLHLVTPHAPLVSQPDCSFSGTPRENKASAYPDQALCVLKAVNTFLEELKSREIYDESLILIHSDHGAELPFDMTGRDGQPTSSVDALRYVGGNPLPLMLIKPRGANGPLQISDNKVQLMDLPATVAALLDLDSPFSGNSMFSNSSDNDRFFYHSTMPTTEASQKDRFDDFIGYKISGSIFDANSWQQVMSHTASAVNELKTYHWNSQISFGSEGNFHEFQTGGWSAQSSPATTWTVDEKASLAMDFGKVDRNVTLRARVRPHLVAGLLEQQRVNILVDGQKAGEWLLIEKTFQDVELLLPAQLFSSGGDTEIVFEFPDAASPIAIGTGKDARQLAVAFMSLQFDLAGTD